MPNYKHILRREESAGYSGNINEKSIPILKSKDYIVIDKPLDGDAPKAFLKVYSFKKGGSNKKCNQQSWESYIAKTGEKWYPQESVIEFMINRIGQTLGLKMNEVCLLKINGQIRFLSKYFLNPKHEVMSHGAEIFGEYLNDMEMAQEIANDKKRSRENFTFEFLIGAIEHKYPHCHQNIIKDIVRMITFDAIAGNNDRHFYNWAVITSIRKNSSLPRLAPIYDSARGLTWNWSEENLIKYVAQEKNNGKKIARYIKEACPRISTEGNFNINHFDLIFFIKNFRNSEYLEIINDLCSPLKEEEVITMIKDEFSSIFSVIRIDTIIHIIKRRFSILREEASC
ncbi:HipA domain-containing protein [Sphingobacterium athyrii]|uniref:HipA-like C-terminal domain-containing protein n=1 Tax=Sphingobacterium athyrii TaxID=2152717 RepID=A0A363NZQ1_9SPHI|nr:HipA domain-containing protein [Sphingobacterium athyrii]PUV26294.1 hypothetical protein DCO56_04905 [Sphingobacterium athyrii]